jgi:hypothetical protein
MTSETGRVPDIAEVADRLAIGDVLAKHSRGVDRADSSVLKSAYWSDAQVEYGGFNGLAHEFCESLPVGIKRFARTQHSISNTAIEFDGDEARVETYVTAYHYLEVDGDQGTEMTYLGRYLDRMQKRDNVWKIIHRQVVMDWNQNVDTTAVWEGPTFSGLARGDRSPDDPLDILLG